MRWLTILSVPLVLGACATDPLFVTPTNEVVSDFVETAQLDQVSSIRKGNRDSWTRVNDRYIIYRGYDDFLVEFRANCGEISKNDWIPADYIHDHRNLRAGEDTIRGCIIEHIYPIDRDQRMEIRNLTQPRSKSI
jgi:hypothetical protein